jgi:hypothetical protein
MPVPRVSLMACLDLLCFLRLDLVRAVNRQIRSGSGKTQPTAASRRQNLVAICYPGHSAVGSWLPPLGKENHPSSCSHSFYFYMCHVCLVQHP